jgi:iron(III) transport system permease protein
VTVADVSAIANARRRGSGRLATGLSVGIVGLLIVLCIFLVFYPGIVLLLESLNVGNPESFPPTALGFLNFASLTQDVNVIRNTLLVAVPATIMAVVIGFVQAWILVRTDVPGRALLIRLMEVPYYLTPLVGAIGWEILCGSNNGFINQLWHWLGFQNDLVDISTPFGIAWVMALFEGTVAFVIISASLRSMDPALEDSSKILGAKQWYTIRRVTLPLVTPAILGATVFVFSEMLGAFAAALVIGLPAGFYVITTSMWLDIQSFPPDYGRAAAMGVVLFLTMSAMLLIYRRIVTRGNYVTLTGKAYRPRPIAMGRIRMPLVALCWAYVLVSIVLPMGAIVLTSFQKFATVVLSQSDFTLQNYTKALHLGGVVTSALTNSLLLGVGVASIGVALMTLMAVVIYRSKLPGRGLIEYIVMFPQAVPRMVFGLALLWAWINMPIPLYGTIWLLGIAYFTVFLPLGVRTLAGVVVQIDRSLDECARVCGASFLHRVRTITVPLLKPGIVAAWFLLFIASVRELGASIFLVGPHSKVIAPAIVSAWADSGTEQVAAIAVIQTSVVMIALFALFVITRLVGAREVGASG